MNEDNLLLHQGGLEGLGTGCLIIKSKNEWLVVFDKLNIIKLLMVESKYIRVLRGYWKFEIYFSKNWFLNEEDHI